MSILKIARMGHPVLHSAAKPVEDPTDEAMARLAADMIETLAEAGGVGLAAPQVHMPARMVIFFVPGERSADGQSQPLTVLINPLIEPLSDEKVPGVEACLSVPGLSGVVPRWNHIVYRGVDLLGQAIEREAKGFHARVVQHECDHLDGMLYPSRLTDFSTFGFVDELRRAAKE